MIKIIRTIFVAIVLFLLVPMIAGAAVGDMTTYPGTGANPYGIAFDGTNMWTTNYKYNNNSVTKISPSGAMTTYTGTGMGPAGIAFDGTNMWTVNIYNANALGFSVTKISPSGTMTTYTGTGMGPSNASIAFDGTNMWTTNFRQNSVTKISPSGSMTTYSGTGAYPRSIAFDGTNMWTANFSYGSIFSVTKISPSGIMTTYAGGGVTFGQYGDSDIAFDGTNMWMTNNSYDDDGYTVTYYNAVTKISPSGTMTTYTGTNAGVQGTGIALGGTNMWITNNSENSVTKISPTGTMTTYTGTGMGPAGIAFDGTNMWTSNYGDNSVTKIVALLPTGTVFVSSNISSSWTITGPATITGSGTSQTSTSKPTGIYTITWGAVAGYTTPASQSLTLTSGTITFNGAYTPNTYTVSTSAGAGGSISPASRTVSSGNTTTFTVTPNSGYTASVSGCSGSLSGTTYTTGTITSVCTVTATFTLTSCINGATVASTCTVCPSGQAYDGSYCVVCTGGCIGAGDINGNGASCINLASNPPFCSVCPIVGQDLLSGICANTVVLPVCGNTVCEVGETTTSCLADCKPKARFWQF